MIDKNVIARQDVHVDLCKHVAVQKWALP